MKTLPLALLLCVACAPAAAADLAEAQKLWDNKEFTRAFQGFSELAGTGNSAAQLQLGEMYGFGEGTAEDVGKAAYWLGKAAAAGNPEAPQLLALVQERAARKTEIAYYVAHFDGAAVAYAKYACGRPAFPAVSTNNADIGAVNAAVRAWHDCYGRFADGLNDAMPITKTIPPGLLKLMNNAEFVSAGALISATYTRIGADAQRVAEQILAESEAWKEATDAYVAKSNQQLQAKLGADALLYQRNQRELEEGRQASTARENAMKKVTTK